MSFGESDENNAEIGEINDQLKVYYKCTDFYEEQLQDDARTPRSAVLAAGGAYVQSGGAPSSMR